MDTKEAIEFVQNKWVTYLDKQEIENKNKVIELLQRGEKFEKMWGKLKNGFKNKLFFYNRIVENTPIRYAKEFIDDLEQKNFPKEE